MLEALQLSAARQTFQPAKFSARTFPFIHAQNLLTSTSSGRTPMMTINYECRSSGGMRPDCAYTDLEEGQRRVLEPFQVSQPPLDTLHTCNDSALSNRIALSLYHTRSNPSLRSNSRLSGIRKTRNRRQIFRHALTPKSQSTHPHFDPFEMLTGFA